MQQSQRLFDLEVQHELKWTGIEPVPNPVRFRKGYSRFRFSSYDSFIKSQVRRKRLALQDTLNCPLQLLSTFLPRVRLRHP